MDKAILQQLKFTLDKAFSMPITRCTYKEVQSAMAHAAGGDQSVLMKLIESLLTKKVTLNLDAGGEGVLQQIIDQYGVKINAAREVHDKGDFINLMTSDLIQQKNIILFTNILRRIDGRFLEFICDVDSFFHMMEHMVNRLEEAQQRDSEGNIFAQHQETIAALSKKLNQLRN